MIDEILFLYLNKELNKKEQAEVETWIKKNPQQFLKIQTIWEKSGIDQSSVKPDKLKIWENIRYEIESVKGKRPTKKTINLKSLLKYAAIFIIGISVIAFFIGKKLNHESWVEFTSDNNITKNLVLPDGSIVSLNKKSKISYKKQFRSKSREVKLSGEAFFQVKKNAQKPFIINVNNTIVKVLGTSFNVNAADISGDVTVSVESGKVLFFEHGDTTNQVYLTTGDKGIFLSVEKKIKKTEIIDKNYLAWKTGILLFKNHTLPEVCKVLTKHFHTNISIGNPVLNTKKITARYEEKSLSEIMELLKIALDIEYVQNNNQIIITGN